MLRCLVPLILLPGLALAQSDIPKLDYQVDPDWPRLPAGWILGETAAVTVDAREHVYIFHRGPHPIIEFDPMGRFVRSWGDGSFPRAHGIRVDPEGNMWAIDAGAHVVVKMNSQGRVQMVLGRFGQPGEGPDRFNGPTDVAAEHVQNSVETRGSPELVVYAAWAWAGGGVDSLASWSSNFGKWR